MDKTFNFVCNYGVLKKNIFMKYTNKVSKIIEVKTTLHFTDEYLEVYLFGIDRNNGKGIHNEHNIYLYNKISKIEFLEDSCTMNIVESYSINLENSKQTIVNNKNFLIDVRFFNDISEIFNELCAIGCFNLIEKDFNGFNILK